MSEELELVENFEDLDIFEEVWLFLSGMGFVMSVGVFLFVIV